MEYLKCLFQFEKYRVDEHRKAIICLNSKYVNRSVILSESGRYLILWERRFMQSQSETSDTCYTEMYIEVSPMVYDLVHQSCYPIPQGRILRQVEEVVFDISPDEQTAMILVRDPESIVVTWWNLETHRIIRTCNREIDDDSWTVTNTCLVNITPRRMTYYASDIKESYKTSKNVRDYYLDDCDCTSRSGELVAVTQRLDETYNGVTIVKFHPIDSTVTRSSRTLKFDLSGTTLFDYISGTPQIQQYLPIFKYHSGSWNLLIIDMQDGKTALNTKIHQDLQNYRNCSRHNTCMDVAMRIIVFEKQALIRVLFMLLSVMHISIYDNLPDTLKYLVCELMSL